MSYLPAYVALERWWLAKRVAVVSPREPEGPQRLAAAGAGRVLVLGAPLVPSPGVEVWAGPFASPLRLPLRDGSVDALLCIEAYAALGPEDRAALVSEARRVLRSTGVLAIYSADLSETEALLRAKFSEVAALAQLPWSGFRLAPVGASLNSDVRLVEDLRTGEPSTGAYLVLASATELGPLVQQCVLVATTPEPASATQVRAIAEVASDEAPPEPSPAGALSEAFSRLAAAAALPVSQPVPPLGPIDEGDVLAALFDPPGEPEPSESAPEAVEPEPPPIDPAEFAALQEAVEKLQRERDSLRERAAELNLPSCVVIFEPQPREFFSPETAPARLTRLRDKLELLAEQGIDRVLCLAFNRRLRELSAAQFVQQVLVEGLGVQHLEIGDDFRFGCDRAGDFSFLQTAGVQNGFTVAQVVVLVAVAVGAQELVDRILVVDSPEAAQLERFCFSGLLAVGR